MDIETLLLVSGFGWAIPCIAWYLASRAKPIGPCEVTHLKGAFYILAALASFLAFYAIFRNDIIFLQGGDEYCRANYAVLWAEDPFFATRIHTWLCGQFYILGALFDLFDNIRMIVVVTSLIGSLATVYFASILAKQMWHSSIAGLFAGILVGVDWIVLWMSVNPHAEVFFLPAFLAALYFFMEAWEIRRNAKHLDDIRRTEMLLLYSAAWVGFGTMFRYEMWYIGLLLGTYLVIRFVHSLFSESTRNLVWIRFIACILIAAYPVAWLLSSWLSFDSPIGFFSRANQVQLVPTFMIHAPTWLNAFVTYPIILWEDHGYRLGIPLSGILVAWFTRNKRVQFFAFLLCIIMLTSMLICIWGGIGNSNRPRYTAFIMLPLFCIGAGSMSYLWSISLAGWRVAARILTTAFLAFTVICNIYLAKALYPNGWKVPTDILNIMMRLEREYDDSRPVRTYVHPLGEYLEVYTQKYLESRMVRYHSSNPSKVKGIQRINHLEKRLRDARIDTHFLIRKPLPDIFFPKRAKFLEDLGPYELWEVGES